MQPKCCKGLSFKVNRNKILMFEQARGIKGAGPGGSAILLCGQDYGFDKVNTYMIHFLTDR